jgi:acetylornithine/succinyldiaminopimelate/putrescine aminotransferase
LGASVAREVVRIIKEEKLIERSKRLGEYFINELKNLARNYDTVKEIRGRGLMIAVEFNRNGESFAAFVRLELLERGFIVAQRPGSNVLRIDPSLTVEESDIKEFLVTFKSIVSEVQNKKQ